MIGQMKYTMIEDNDIVSAVEKLTPAPGNIFLFLIKTDDQGVPNVDLEVVQQTANIMGEVLGEYGAKGIFLFDKICLFHGRVDKQTTLQSRFSVNTAEFTPSPPPHLTVCSPALRKVNQL